MTETMTETTTATAAARRRREIAFLARELSDQAQGVVRAVGDLVPGELAGGDGELRAGTALEAVAQRLDEALACFDLLQEELGRPGDREPRYRGLLGGLGSGGDQT
jgi:hypothetical protein